MNNKHMVRWYDNEADNFVTSVELNSYNDAMAYCQYINERGYRVSSEGFRIFKVELVQTVKVKTQLVTEI